MKSNFLSVFLLFSIISFAQNTSVVDTNKATLSNKAMKSASGNEKSIFGGYITGVADLLSTSGGALSLQGSLWGIKQAVTGHAKDTLDYRYIKHVLLRNTQLNAGVSPDKKKDLKIDTITFGVSFTILNNKIAKRKIWDSVYSIYQRQASKDLALSNLENSLANTPGSGRLDTLLIKFINSKGKDSSNIREPLRTQILNAVQKRYLSEIYEVFDKASEDFSNKVTKQWLWVASINGKYDLIRSNLNGYIFSTTVSKAIYADNKKGRQVSFQINPSYTTTKDTTDKLGKTNRNYTKVVGGFNYMICKSFEINLLGSWTHIINGLYKGEKVEQYALSVTPRIKISNNFWLPITIKYDIVHPQFFGYISIQYSLK